MTHATRSIHSMLRRKPAPRRRRESFINRPPDAYHDTSARRNALGELV
jgi:hypothetical protein